MSAALTLASKALAFGDANSASNNPLRRHFDWTRTVSMSVRNPKAVQEIIEAGQSYTFFSGVRSTSVAADTAFSVTPSALVPGRYRFTHAGGTSPALRANRALTLAGADVTVGVDANGTATWTLTNGGSWAGLTAGDTVYVPGPAHGDGATPFNPLNTGFWVVLAVASSTVAQLVRPSGTLFEAAAETVSVTVNAQVQAFGAIGVQVGDKVDISAAFAPGTQGTYTVETVTAEFFEVVSGRPLATETRAPGTAGLVFYSNAKRFLRIESDQEVAVRLNGDGSDSVRVSPLQAGDSEQVGWFEKVGPVWALTVVNKGPQAATIDVFSAE